MRRARNISPKITVHGKYALVKYEPGMSLRALLQIYGISEKRTDLVRSLLSGNNLAYNHTTLTLAGGRPIPAGKVLQMPTRLISSALVDGARERELRAAFAAQDDPDTGEDRHPAASGIWDTLSRLMQDEAARFAAYGGAAIVGIVIAIGIAATLLQNQSGSAKTPVSLEQALQQRLRAIHQERDRVEEEARRQAAQERLASIRTGAQQRTAAATGKNSPATSTAGKQQSSTPLEPVITSLEPGQGDIDMRNVGVVRLSQNSSSSEIVRVIEAYNALPPAKKK